MKNNKLISYKESVFSRILNFFKKLFFKKKKATVEAINETLICNILDKNSFIENIGIKENEEVKRLKELKIKYDNEDIDEKDLSDEDMNKLIKMYKNETEELNADTERRKIHTAQMLKELKST